MFYNVLPLDLPVSSAKSDLYFIDFETTGLCKQKDCIVVASLLQYCHNQWFLHQWHLENLDEEFFLLRDLLHVIQANSSIYTYNGKSFELAFLKSKIEYYNLSYDYSLQWVDFKDLPSFKAFTKQSRSYNRLFFEETVGFTRTISTSGKERAKLAKLLLQYPNDSYRQLLLTYSQEEVLSLVKLYQFHQFLIQMTPHNFLYKDFSPIDEESHLPQKIVFTLSCHYLVDFDIHFSIPPYTLNYNASTTTLSLHIDMLTGILVHYLNPKEYFIVNGELLHASLAHFVPSSYKHKPKKDECFLRQSGTFIPTTLSTSDKIWFDAHHMPYILITSNYDYLSTLTLFCEKFSKNK